MRLCVFDDHRVGVVVGEEVLDVTDALGVGGDDPLVAMTAAADRSLAALDAACRDAPRRLPLGDVRLRAPVRRPGKIVAAPVNYVDHMEEMQSSLHVSGLGVFLKAPSSVIGPGETIRLPYHDRRFDQEGELAFVIGRSARHVPAAAALDHVFGYTCLIDVTMRGGEDRSTRKSFDTFTPVGPWVVTADELGDAGSLDLRCWVNDDLRQKANTSSLIWGVASLVEYVSSVMTLHPGDIVTTGTPAGVGPLADGDRVAVEIERVGRLEVSVSGEGATTCPTDGAAHGPVAPPAPVR